MFCRWLFYLIFYFSELPRLFLYLRVGTSCSDYLRSHLSISQPKALRSRARSYLFELCQATCPEESRFSFCFPFSPAKFLTAATNLCSSTATAPDKVVYSMLQHLLHSGTDFLRHIFNLSWFLYSFLSIWKTSFVIHIHKIGKPFDSSAFFLPISLTSCVLTFFGRTVLSRLFFFLKCNLIFSPFQVSALEGLPLVKFCFFLSPFRMGLTNQSRLSDDSCYYQLLKRFRLRLASRPFPQTYFTWRPPCFAGWTQSFLSDRCAWLIF